MNKIINIDFFQSETTFFLCSNDKLGQMKHFSWTQLNFWLFLFAEKNPLPLKLLSDFMIFRFLRLQKQFQYQIFMGMKIICCLALLSNSVLVSLSENLQIGKFLCISLW